MTSYAKHSGFLLFNWNKFLEKKSFTSQELKDAQIVAGDWITGPTGALDYRIPRQKDGRPIDSDLQELDQIFYSAIKEKKLRTAKEALVKIHEKGNEVLTKLVNENKSTIFSFGRGNSI